jgi:anti-sigma factor RsiW
MNDRDPVQRTAESLRRFLTSEHPASETTLVAYVDGTLDPEEREAVDEHLLGCVTCREDVADLSPDRRGRLSLHGEARRPLTRWLLAASLGGAVLLGGYLTMRAPTPAPHIPAVAYRNAEWDALVRQARVAERIDAPRAWKAIQTDPDVLRGTQPAATHGIFTPAASVIESQQPRFSWPATPGAGYVVRVSSSTGEVAHSDALREAVWSPSAPLPRGATYTWQVEVRDHAGAHVIPAPPHPPLLFSVLDEKSMYEISEARRRASDDHFLLGLLYARAGARERAREELEQWIAVHPADRTARAIAGSLDRWQE